jgi:hypothetical protein
MKTPAIRGNRPISSGWESLQNNTGFWQGVSLYFALLCGAVLLLKAFQAPYVIQDDGRQHVFWMWRFMDRGLFPGDLIADYFQSVATPGYSTLYGLAARAGIDPVFFSRVLPILILTVTAFYLFRTSLALFSRPAAACLASVLLTQLLATNDDIPSATPRAFVYPCFAAFLYYLAAGRLLPCLAALALIGLFYPQVMLVAAGVLVLRLARFTEGRLRLSGERRDYLAAAGGLLVTALVLLPYMLSASRFGPIIPATQARLEPEFGPGGRSAFFSPNPLEFWLYGERSGIMPPAFPSLLLLAALALPSMLRRRDRFPLLKRITPEARILAQVTLASLGMFFAAHALIFKLHLPSRYTRHTLLFVLALAAGIALLARWDAFMQRVGSEDRPGRGQWVGWAAVGMAFLFLFPFVLVPFWNSVYVVGPEPALYRYFSAQPKDTLIASISDEANNLPVFARRPVLVCDECAIPYHQGYYRRFRERMEDLLRAQYSPDPAEVLKLIRKYGVDYLVLDRDAFEPGYLERKEKWWLKQFDPVRTQVLTGLQQGEQPVLARVAPHATVFQTDRQIVLRADLVVSRLGE